MVPHRKDVETCFQLCPRMEPRPIRLLVRSRLTKPITGTGRESGSPEMGTETRAQALRGAAVAKPPQCTKVRWGYPECRPLRMAFLQYNALEVIRGGQGWCQPPR